MFKLLIVYDTNRIAQVEDVQDYGFIDNTGMFYFLKDNVRNFIPQTHVLYFGRAEDWYSI